MQRQHILHGHAPHHHQHRQPAIGRPRCDEPHVPRCDQIERQRGRNIPEGQFVVQPEIPVDGDIANQVDKTRRETLRSQPVSEVKGSGHHHPCRHDAQQSPAVEVHHRGLFAPSEPQSDTTEQEEDIHAHIAHTLETEKHVTTREGYMEEDDADDGQSHQNSPMAGNGGVIHST